MFFAREVWCRGREGLKVPAARKFKTIQKFFGIKFNGFLGKRLSINFELFKIYITEHVIISSQQRHSCQNFGV